MRKCLQRKWIIQIHFSCDGQGACFGGVLSPPSVDLPRRSSVGSLAASIPGLRIEFLFFPSGLLTGNSACGRRRGVPQGCQPGTSSNGFLMFCHCLYFFMNWFLMSKNNLLAILSFSVNSHPLAFPSRDNLKYENVVFSDYCRV